MYVHKVSSVPSEAKKGSWIALGEVVSCHVGAADQRMPGPPEEQPGLRRPSHCSSYWFALSS